MIMLCRHKAFLSPFLHLRFIYWGWLSPYSSIPFLQTPFRQFASIPSSLSYLIPSLLNLSPRLPFHHVPCDHHSHLIASHFISSQLLNLVPAHFTQLHSTPLHFISFHPIPSHLIPSNLYPLIPIPLILFHFIPFYLIPSYVPLPHLV